MTNRIAIGLVVGIIPTMGNRALVRHGLHQGLSRQRVDKGGRERMAKLLRFSRVVLRGFAVAVLQRLLGGLVPGLGHARGAFLAMLGRIDTVFEVRVRQTIFLVGPVPIARRHCRTRILQFLGGLLLQRLAAQLLRGDDILEEVGIGKIKFLRDGRSGSRRSRNRRRSGSGRGSLGHGRRRRLLLRRLLLGRRRGRFRHGGCRRFLLGRLHLGRRRRFRLLFFNGSRRRRGRRGGPLHLRRGGHLGGWNRRFLLGWGRRRRGLGGRLLAVGSQFLQKIVEVVLRKDNHCERRTRGTQHHKLVFGTHRKCSSVSVRK